MIVDLATQIRDYAAAVDAVQEPMGLDEIAQVRLSTEAVQPLHIEIRRPVPGWVSAVTATAVVLLFGGVAFLLGDWGGTGEPAATPLPTVVPTAVMPTAPPVIAGWSRVSDERGVFGGPGSQGMSDVIVAGPGFVGVGADSDDAAVWNSVDGLVWSRVPHDESVFGDGDMSSVVAGSQVVVAVGGGDVWWGGGSHAGSAIVWTSPAGISWTRVAHDENVFGDAFMSDITVGGPGFVVVGSIYRDGDRDAAGYLNQS